jgi:AcrR family transcriptional regulator
MAKSDAAGATLGRPRDRMVDETLIRVTLELLSQTGIEGVTMALVGRRSGLPASTIYRRYPDARSLVLAAIKADLDQTSFDLTDQGSLRADLLAFLHVIAAGLGEGRARLLAGLLLPVQTDPVLEALFTTKIDAIRNDGWRGVIGRAVQRGELRPEALQAQPLDDVAHTMIFYRAVVKRHAADEAFLANLLDNVLAPALEPFRT